MRGGKTALVTFAAIAATAIPATAQATEWTVDGLRSDATTEVAGMIVLARPSTAKVTCMTSLEASHTNGLTTAGLSVTAVDFASCDTDVSGCTASAVPTSLPWSGTGGISGGVSRFQLPSVSFSVTYGAGCPAPLTSATITETGSFAPEFVASGPYLLLDGTSASGTLTSSLGTAHLNGGFDLRVATPVGGSLGLQ